jgi:hypothetical protein
MLRRTFTWTSFLIVAAAWSVAAQPQPRRATTIAAIRAYPGFYHQQTVLVVGEVKGTEDRATVSDEGSSIRLVARELPREGRLEVRGQLLDIGRVSQDDPRLIPFNLLDRIRAAYQDRWPKPGEEIILLLGGTSPPPPATNATTPPLRAVAMEPSRFDAQKITITGQFRGRNLFGDLPEEPTQGKYQFVLRSGDAALWIVGLQPKGKTFNFDPSKRIDTGRWVTVQGTVHSARGLTWLDGSSIELAPTPQETTQVTIDLPPPPPVEILFIAPEEGEGDVKTTERIRVQLSRDLDPATLKDHIRFTPEVAFTTNYTRENRALEIRPSAGLPAQTLVKVEFLEGIKGPDGGALKPFTLTFTTGSS